MTARRKATDGVKRLEGVASVRGQDIGEVPGCWYTRQHSYNCRERSEWSRTENLRVMEEESSLIRCAENAVGKK
jgi:hypothetical protein